jgi:hypothetical protein
MAMLGPAIHELAPSSTASRVDGRHEAGHDTVGIGPQAGKRVARTSGHDAMPPCDDGKSQSAGTILPVA